MDIPSETQYTAVAKKRGRGGGRGVRGRGRATRRARRTTGRGRGRRDSGSIMVQSEDLRKEKAKDLIKRMTDEAKTDLLCTVVEKQPGLILDIVDRVDHPDQGYHPDPGESSTSWCVCNRCREMPTEVERVCCGYTPDNCISRLPDMDRYILDEGVLSLARVYRQEVLVYGPDQHVCKANRLWRAGRLGTGNRQIIPSCCVWRIRDTFPDPFRQYKGFVPSRLG